ncbi:YkvA family protein [Mesorhizobium sp. Z1-4]|uniref:YkvA family protein n=1 Tax=Mesorhizobium sp. Z1-4 TaxID=2448478 RepID=UPI000FDC3776|nr:YkvA family protein [Mesorhizobium sp. Z1-4]
MTEQLDHVTIGAVLAPVSAEETRWREERVRSKFWRTVKRAVRQIPFMDEVVAAYYCALDTETPTRARGILLASLAYFVLPTDLIPDFLVAFGFTDDLAVLTAAITAIRPHIKDHHRQAAKRALEDNNR